MAAGNARRLRTSTIGTSRSVYSLALRIVGEEARRRTWCRRSSHRPGGRRPIRCWQGIRGGLAVDHDEDQGDRSVARAAVAARSGDRVGRGFLERLVAPVQDPAVHMAAEQDAVRVRRALGELPLLQRVAIELAFFEGLTQRRSPSGSSSRSGPSRRGFVSAS